MPHILTGFHMEIRLPFVLSGGTLDAGHQFIGQDMKLYDWLLEIQTAKGASALTTAEKLAALAIAKDAKKDGSVELAPGVHQTCARRARMTEEEFGVALEAAHKKGWLAPIVLQPNGRASTQLTAPSNDRCSEEVLRI